ncbi:chemoreceptor glutamine deamidase CheD [Oceanicella actignis]|uniref:Probable chemoreceptor glutamine deamidase CheD n=1 Tax=Oceanicella actignis TaxID=1189325 RepID=A0A1M7T5C6_9RHOB|nr:chemoreceptor glutamine deamidase CheD [Oceanicella actignis]SET43233.1 chemotaxis protein CheD [Oceanicella actignis]SHN65943.1 chemotaxis protein CheD [Oceanicella actignis]
MKAMALTDQAAHFDPRLNAKVVSVLPGNYHVIDGDAAISTLLGSCVAACIRDRDAGIGGLNHFILPASEAAGDLRSARYGVFAMELLINEILRRGGRKDRLEAKIFGGARVVDSGKDDTVGDRNGRFVKAYLSTEGIPVLAEDLGGERPRRVFFFPSTGRVLVQRLARSAAMDESAVARRAIEERVSARRAGGIELFE